MIDLAYIKTRVAYDHETGDFTWLPKIERNGYDRRFNAEKAGRKAGNINNQGYVRIKIDGVTYAGHRLAWWLFYGEPPSRDIDHKNRKRHDNRISNLRLATPTLNGANQSLATNNTSGAKGVYLVKGLGRWRARLFFTGGSISLGTYTTREEAKAAYIQGAANMFGDYATDGEAA